MKEYKNADKNQIENKKLQIQHVPKSLKDNACQTISVVLLILSFVRDWTGIISNLIKFCQSGQSGYNIKQL